MPTALIVVGSGRYADPWHPFAANAVQVERTLAEAGFETRVDTDVDRALGRLADVDLLVVLAGDPWRDNGDHADGSPHAADVGAPAASIASLTTAIERGIGVLAFHSASASLRDYPVWAGALGGVWLPEISMHPEIGTARITVHADRHPIVDGLADFELFDERYSRIQRTGEVAILAEHEHEGVRHPVLWAREHGPSRIVYDALGHDERSFASPEHLELVRRSAAWAVGTLGR
ncbi:ThuA domain-containing protein [Plantibacter sp. YIM 135347]|uniref:ThuA domain-containing protein n=1 Tax=Plantibacter sp. YIM 135347 TaxID=3423919 RepID=UPI003D350423